jgi:hypothetical protein
MANMTLIEAKTLSSTAGSITFSAIPQTYTDLKILVSARDDRSGQPNTDLSLRVGYNGTINTGSIYSNIQLYGNGSATGSQSSSTDYAYLGMSNGPTSTAGVFGNTAIYITNYTSANNKSVNTEGASENNATAAWIVANSNLISTSNPITDIQIDAVYGAGLFQIGSTFYLYGISSAPNSASPKATGGIVYQDATYWYHTFLSSGTLIPSDSLTNVDYLVVAGGGSGGSHEAGGGGAGGLRSTVEYTGGGGTLESKISLSSGVTYTVAVGAGAAGTSAGTAAGNDGGSSSISGSGLTTITSTGGGGGGGGTDRNGHTGGSGGGSHNASGTAGARTASPVQGNNGGGPGGAGGGGGGAGAAGNTNGLGGIGALIPQFANITYTGDRNYYASGGNAGYGPGFASPGGGSIGANIAPGNNAMANTGGGGGAIVNAQAPSGAGGSGLVIVRYAK